MNFEDHLNKYTLTLIQHLIKTEQAKNSVVNFVGAVLGLEKEEALRFYNKYKESLSSSVGRASD